MGLPLYLYLYFGVLAILALFGLHRYYLVFLHRRFRSRVLHPPSFEELGEGNLPEPPFVTVQLPIYNEQYVLPRLLGAVVNLDYPRDRLQIQLLDDSTDETARLAEEMVARYQQEGVPIELVSRSNREGYKAGALNEGLKSAKGELIAVFDADFVPGADFLKKMVPYFSLSHRLGMVQARWGHLNPDFSLLTQTQSIFLDGHFMVEHAARNRSGLFFNFNGTAGVWRRQCIEEAGGWSAATLTEDLYLSYKAQMKGWQFYFANDVVVPAELPVDVNSFRSQQHRWAKGSIQTAVRLLPTIMKSSLPLQVKVESFFHLCGNLAYLLLLVVSLLMPFSIYSRHLMHWKYLMILDIPLFVGATLSVVTFYLYAHKEIEGKLTWSRLKYIPINLAIGIGLCVNNAYAVLEALVRSGGEFVRTPKYNVMKKGDSWLGKKYKMKGKWIDLIEWLLAIYYTYALYYVLENRLFMSVPFVLLFDFAFLYMSFLSLRSSFGRPAAPSLEGETEMIPLSV